jgi:MSHA biogenesis protein MshN
VQLESVEVKEGKGRTRLSFVLSGETEHQIAEGEEPATLYLSISNTVLAGELPSLELQGTPIRSIEAIRTGENLTIRLELGGEVTTKTSMLSDSDSARLILDLYGAVPDSDVTEVVPTPAVVPQDSVAQAEPAQPESTLPEAPAPPASAASMTRVLKKFRPPTPQELSASLYERGLRLVEHGRYEDAVESFMDALSQLPTYKPAREQLATVLIRMDQSDQAVQVLEEGLKQSPKYAPYAKLQAHILTSRDAVAEALNVLRSAAPDVAQDPEYHAFVAALYQRQGEHGLAVGIYNQVLREQSDQAVWWMGLGISLEAGGQIDDALVAFSRASARGLDPESRRYVDRRIRMLQEEP